MSGFAFWASMNVLLLAAEVFPPPMLSWVGGLVWSAIAAALAVAHVIRGDLGRAVGCAAIAGMWAWYGWKRRPPRKRRPSRIAGRVRDLGHRLVVTP